jgi:hypothetical protein
LGKQEKEEISGRKLGGNERLEWALLKRWRFEEEKTQNLQLIQSSPHLLSNFKLRPFSILAFIFFRELLPSNLFFVYIFGESFLTLLA